MRLGEQRRTFEIVENLCERGYPDRMALEKFDAKCSMDFFCVELGVA